MRQRGQRFLTGWENLIDADTGRLASSVPLDGLWVPGRVQLERDVLHFGWTEFDVRKPSSALLDRFLGLHTDDAFLSFAERFGPLGLSQGGEKADPQPFMIPRGEQKESLKAWRRYQWEFNALLTLAAALRERESPKRELFEEFQRLGVLPAPTTPASLWDLARSAIGVEEMQPSILDKHWSPYCVNEWSAYSVNDRLDFAADVLRIRAMTFIRWCGLRPALTFESRRRPPSRITLAFQDALTHDSSGVGISLFGALVVQLLAAATGAGFAVCSACGRVFVPRRRQPAFGKRRYCPTCGREAAVRDAKTQYQAKLRRLGVRRMRDLRSGDVKRRGKNDSAKPRSAK